MYITLFMLLGLLLGCNGNRPVANARKVAQVDELIVQPIGGFVGAGPSSRVRSEGRIAMSALSSEDQAKVEALFSHPQPAPGNFYYRIIRQGPNGTKSVDVPVEAVPAVLTASVKTTLE